MTALVRAPQHSGMCGFTRTLSLLVLTATAVSGVGRAKPAPPARAPQTLPPGTRICEPAKARC
ncbi:hypothetical protein [Mycobacterium sp. 3519A]|uniref:hypothetical protein n=1 Tax=Mycobacterium sp. 3519A TaxID=2057184 RepID=UPI00115A9532|nr:hypothetical protein [Mycobacterium sp. 3519A]